MNMNDGFVSLQIEGAILYKYIVKLRYVVKHYDSQI